MADILVTELAHETTSTLDGAERFIMYDTLAGKTISISEVSDYILGNMTFTDSNSDGNIVIAV